MRYTTYHGGKAVIRNRTLLGEAMAKLAAYEDAEEAGKLAIVPDAKKVNEWVKMDAAKRLAILPCALGDTSYWISDADTNAGNDEARIHTDIVTGIALSPEGTYIWSPRDRDFNKVGSRWAILSKDEAWRMLNEMIELENDIDGE